jgi:hypothetical protein
MFRFLEAVAKQARSFSCLFGLRPLMQRPGNSNLLSCFLAWRLADRIWRSFKGKVFFLLVWLTASYPPQGGTKKSATSSKQQSVPLFAGVASGRLHLNVINLTTRL